MATADDKPDLEKLRALAEASTPGPWQPWRRGNSTLANGVVRGLSELKGVESPYHPAYVGARDPRAVYMTDEDAEFVAASRTAVPWLLDRMTELERELTDERRKRAPALAADGMELVLRVAPNDDAELTCLLCGCATNAPPELCTTFLAPHGSSTAGLHRRCYERAAVPRRGPFPAPAGEGPPRWRVGRTLGRTLYRDDRVVGMVDTPEMAAEIVGAVNREPSAAIASQAPESDTEYAWLIEREGAHLCYSQDAAWRHTWVTFTDPTAWRFADKAAAERVIAERDLRGVVAVKHGWWVSKPSPPETP